MSPFHFCLSAAKNLGSFQLLPASLTTDVLQLFLGLPLFLFPWGFQSRGAFGISPSSFLNVGPIHLNFLFLISKFISSCPVTFHRSLLEIIFGHHILNTYLRHLFTKVSHVIMCTYSDVILRVALYLTFCVRERRFLGSVENARPLVGRTSNITAEILWDMQHLHFPAHVLSYYFQKVSYRMNLQAARSRVQFPMVLLKFFIDIILPAALWSWDWLGL